MSDSSAFGFGKFVPGFDFLQNLGKGPSGGIPQMPNLSSWVAPTISVEELEKRIEELKAVQFWLEQNSRALTATVQALEVQKMTLATLKGMNVSMGDVANAFKLKTDAVMGNLSKAGAAFAQSAARAPAPGSAAAASSDARTENRLWPAAGSTPAPAPVAEPSPAPAAADPQASSAKVEQGAPSADTPTKGAKGTTSGTDKAASGGIIDPMQWWGSLTQQFQQIAGVALKDAAQQAAMENTRNMASEAMKAASGLAEKMTAQGAKVMRGAHGSAAGTAKARSGPETAAPGTSGAAKKSPARKASTTRATTPTAAKKAAVEKPVAKKPAAKKAAAKASAAKKAGASRRAS